MSVRIANVGSLEDLEAVEAGEMSVPESRSGARKRPDMSPAREAWLQQQRRIQSAYAAEGRAKRAGKVDPPRPEWMGNPALLPKRPPGK